MKQEEKDQIHLTELIALNFEIEQTSEITEEELETLLAERVAYMLDHRLEFLLSLMYRLDVEESKINFALSPLSHVPPSLGIARLIIDRQKQRLATKLKYKKGDEDPWDGL